MPLHADRKSLFAVFDGLHYTTFLTGADKNFLTGVINCLIVQGIDQEYVGAGASGEF